MAKNNNPGKILKGTQTQPSLKGASGVWTLDEALQYHRANKWPQPNLFQPVANSLRMSRAKVSYLTKSSTLRDGSLMAGTFSFWMKPSVFYGASADSAYQLYQTAYTGSSNWRSLISSTGADYSQLYFAGYNGAGTLVAEIYPTWGIRDISAWYHIVLAFDTTQPTASNRFKMYVNGVQITTFSSATYPAQNTQLGFFKSGLDRYLIGINRQLANPYYDGYLAEFNAVDGYGLQPSMFGQFDSNNTWVPIAYTGSYGTNGFYLPFNNATTSQTLGYDASLNGTPTFTADQDPYRSSVALHLTGNGPAGQQNNTFADSSTNNLAITRQGTPTQGSFSPYPFNTNSLYNPSVNGASMYTSSSLNSNNFLTTAATSALEFGSGNFTIEFWWYPTSTTRQALYHASYGTDWSVGIDFNSTGVQSIGIWASSNGTSWNLLNADPGGNAVGTLIVNQNAWNHVAYVRNGTTWQSYLNGVLDKSITGLSGTIVNRASSAKAIGSWWSTSSMSTATGYISGFRIITGQAVYTSAFTPTNRPFGTLTNNLITFSEDFTNTAYWGIASGTITPNATVAPDGTPTGTLLTQSGSSTAYLTLVAISITNGTTYTFSAYVKAASQSSIFILLYNTQFGAGVNNVYSRFDLSTVTASATGGSPIAQTITSVGNGWFRISMTATANATTTLNAQFLRFTDPGVTSTIYCWGAQIDVGSTMTNYVPTPANYATAPTLLLNFANAAIIDSTGANNAITNVSSTITASSKYGSGALTFNGSSYLTLTGATGSTNFGTGDWTVECWWKANGTQSNYTAIISQGFTGSPPAGTWGLKVTGGSTNLQFTYDASLVNVGQNINSSINANDSNWHHIAVVRNLSKLYMFIDGTLVGNNSIPSSQVVGNTSSDILIGYQSRDGSYLNGTVDDLRVTKGVARYIDNFTPPQRALPETGGKSFVTTNINAGVVQRFTTVGTTSWTAPSDVTQIEVLVVAAGGTGASDSTTNVGNGGGGGGGLIYNSAYPVAPGQTYTVTVGAGQVGLYTGSQRSGGNSQFGNLIAIGGGGGGYYSNASGATGGSGGGGGAAAGGAGAGTAGQGFAGASGSSNNGGGGGGAGGTATGTNNRDGGPGLQFGISGTPTYYAGGGGGSASSGAQGAGGLGGGGAAVNGGSGGVDGTANTGGGGGAQINSGTKGGNGGSGVVIVRYTTNTVGNTSDTTTDTLTDSPTQYGHDTGAGGEVVGNYATWNPLLGANMNTSAVVGSSVVVYANGNLSASNPIAAGQAPRMQCHSNIGMTTGKWYAEFTNITTRQVGISKGDYLTYSGTGVDSLISYYNDGTYNTTTGASGTFSGTGGTFTSTDVVGVAVDVDNATVNWYVNGVNRLTITNIASSTRPTLPWYFSSNPSTSGATSSVTANFGQRAWQYNPPAGYNALTTKNFARPSVGSAAETPNQYFDTVLYTGTGSARSVSGFNFQPDLLWIKDRSGTGFHRLFDRVRGATNSPSIYSNSNAIEAVDNLTFTSNGFSYTTDPYGSGVNTTSNLHVVWGWRAGGAPVSNTSGTITSSVSANTTNGFSIATWSGNNTNGATIGHGLTSAPSMFIIKARNATTSWYVWHTGLTGATYGVSLDSTAGQAVFTYGTATVGATTITAVSGANGLANINATSVNYVGYFWTEVAGFSKFGSYTGNGNADGPFIYCGFKPRFVMMKRIDTTEVWAIIDTARDTYNVSYKRSLPNSAAAENTSDANCMDILSTGFKLKSTDTTSNALNSTYIFMAFADRPFGNTNGTAR
jgi:hypothetical protein